MVGDKKTLNNVIFYFPPTMKSIFVRSNPQKKQSKIIWGCNETNHWGTLLPIPIIHKKIIRILTSRKNSSFWGESTTSWEKRWSQMRMPMMSVFLRGDWRPILFVCIIYFETFWWSWRLELTSYLTSTVL